MMYLSSLLLGLMIGFWSANACAGQEVGNGGDAVVCLNSQGEIERAVLYDYFESEAKWVLTPRIANSGADEWGIVQNFLDEFEKVQPFRGQAYKLIFEKFKRDHRIAPNVRLVDVPDSDSSIMPFGCTVEQVAIQRRPEFPLDKYFIIAGPLWEKMDSLNRAGLILHEIIYFDLIESGAVNSKIARYVHSNIVSTNALKFSAMDYFKLYRNSEAKNVEFNRRLFVNNNSLRFSEGPAGLYVTEGEVVRSLREEKLTEQFRDPNAPVIRIEACKGSYINGQWVKPLLHRFTADGSLLEGCTSEARVYLQAYGAGLFAKSLAKTAEGYKFEFSNPFSADTLDPVELTFGRFKFLIIGTKGWQRPPGFRIDSISIRSDGTVFDYVGTGLVLNDEGQSAFFSQLKVPNQSAPQAVIEGFDLNANQLKVGNVSGVPIFLKLNRLCKLTVGNEIGPLYDSYSCRSFLKFPNEFEFPISSAKEIVIDSSTPGIFARIAAELPHLREEYLFDLNGEIRCHLGRNSRPHYKIKFRNKEETLEVSIISFDSNGRVMKFRAAEGWRGVLESAGGNSREYFHGEMIWLDSEGRVTKSEYPAKIDQNITSDNIVKNCF